MKSLFSLLIHLLAVDRISKKSGCVIGVKHLKLPMLIAAEHMGSG